MSLLTNSSRGIRFYAADVDIILLSVILTVALAILFDFTNGFHDAANATSTVIATRSLKPKTAVILSAVFNFIPAFVVGTAVANTISKTVQLDALPDVAAGSVPLGVRMTLAALLAAIFWNYLTWHLGLPSSSSHALIGGLVGAGISAGGVAAVSWDSVEKTVVAIFASPLIAFVIAFVAMKDGVPQKVTAVRRGMEAVDIFASEHELTDD